MDNKRYEVRQGFAEGLEVLGSLAEKDREKPRKPSPAWQRTLGPNGLEPSPSEEKR